MILTGAAEPRHWAKAEDAVSFYDLKGLAEAALEFMGVPYTFEKGDFGSLEPGATMAIRVGETPIGYLGQVRSDVLRNYDLEQPVFLLELDLSDILARSKAIPQFQSIGKFPPSMRDMAVVVDESVPAGELCLTAKTVGGKLLKNVEIFDIYRGNPVPEGKKSVALNLVFQSEERTLKDKDTQKAWDKILKKLSSAHRAELR